MKDMRGLYPFASMAVDAPGKYVGINKAGIQVYKKSESRFAEKTGAGAKRARIAVQILPILACCLLLNFVRPAHAQSTFGSVRGIVQDNTNAVIPDSQVVLRSTDENTERTVNADVSGNFIFENVKAGKYSLLAHHDGFADTTISGISVEARQDVRLTVSLAVAAQMTTVEVSSGGEQINTENATLGDSKSNLEMTQLPLNNRATTTSPLGALGLSPNVQTDSSGNIALGGASSSMVNFSVDGISTANVRQNGALQDAYPSQEGIAAVKVTSFNNSAEFSQVGDVTFTTKNGTNDYHGSVFEYLQNQALDASSVWLQRKGSQEVQHLWLFAERPSHDSTPL